MGDVDVLVLGGTAWLGREISRQALAQGHAVTCLARGEAGAVADGATLVAADRSEPDAYDAVRGRSWDAVVEVSWQPAFVRAALAALAGQVAHWTYVSSCSVYARHDVLGADESGPLLDATDADKVDGELYGSAKVTCEQISAAALGDRLLIARAGLIGGPGDHTGRSGYWVARAARDRTGPMLVPDALEQPTQVVDVRDLSAWIVTGAGARLVGTYDTVGPILSLGDWITLSRTAGGHSGPLVRAGRDWLIDHDVEDFSGPASLPMWVAQPGWEAFMGRSGAAAAAAGLRHRPRVELIADVLAWEREAGLDRPRRAGLSAAREAELIAALNP